MKKITLSTGGAFLGSLNFKIVLVFLFSVFSFVGLNGQVANYMFAQSSGTYTALTGGTILGSTASDDEVFNNNTAGATGPVTSTGFPIGFNFTYNGTVYDKFAVSTNGYIVLGTGSFVIADVTSGLLGSSTTGTFNSITPMQMDLIGQAGSEMMYLTSGVSPNRVLTVQWKGIKRYTAGTNTSSLNFQIKLEETTNKVYIVYGSNTTNGSWNPLVGLKGSSSSDFNSRTTTTNWSSTTASSSNTSNCTLSSTVFPASGQTYAWTPPTLCTAPSAQPTVFTAGTNTSASIAGSFTAATGSPSGYLVVRSAGALNTNPTDGAAYTAGGTIGNGTVIQSGNGLSFSSSSLVSNTDYTITVFSFNSGSCLTKYNISSPLKGTLRTCAAAPTSLSVTSVTSSGATFSWTSALGGSASAISSTLNIYSNSGYSTLVTSVPNVTSSYVFTSGLLNPNTTYYYQIVNTNTGGCSSSTNGGSFTTACAAVSSFPWTENFDSMSTLGANVLPSCWLGVTGSTAWTSSNAAVSTTSPGPYSGANYVRLYYNNTTASNLYTPGFALSAGQSYDFTFYYRTSTSGANGGGFIGDVYVNTAQSVTGATLLGRFVNTADNVGYTLYKYTFTPTTAGTYYFNLRATSNSATATYYLGIDDFKLELSPTCQQPTSLVSSSITTNSANIGWSAPSSAPLNGYEYYYSTSNITPSISQTPSGSAGAGIVSAGLSLLLPATKYYFWIRSNCGTDKSAWSTVGTFTTACSVPNAPSGVTVSNVTSTTLTVGFTAASPVPSGYMLFLSTTTTTPPALSSGTTYNAGTNYTIGGQVYRCVVSNGTSTSYNLTGGIPNTQHNYFVFSSSSINTCYGAPWYSTSANGSALTCAAAPTSLSATSMTSSGATFSWTSSTDGGVGAISSTLNIYSDSSYSTLVTTVPNVTSPYTFVSGLLSSGSTYYYQIVNSNVGGCSSSVNGGGFTTACIVKPITVTEGFNSTIKPNCWTVQYPSTTNIGFLAYGANPPTAPYEGSGMIRYNSYNTSSDERLMSLSMSSIGVSSVDLEFMWRNDNTAFSTATYDTEGVQIQYSLDGTTWTNITGAFFKRVDTSLPSGGAKWNKKTITLPSAVANKSVFYIGFNFLSEYGNNMFLDAIRVQPTPASITISSSQTIPICNGDSNTLTASSASGYSYTWSPNAWLSSTTGATVIATPTETTTYTVTGVLDGVIASQTITITVNPSTTPVVLTNTDSPVGADACILDYVELDASGGEVATVLLSETFNSNTLPAGWSANNASNGGGTPANANWTIRNDGYTYLDTDNGVNTFKNSDGNNFILSNSDAQGGSTSTNNTTRLITPSFSSVGMDHLNLTFYANYEYNDNDHFYIDVSTDGGATYTNGVVDVTNPDRLGTLTIDNTDGTYTFYTETLNKYILNLDSYINQSNLKIRFRYVHTWDYWVALDNIEVYGTKQSINWSPITGLYTDSNLSTAYTSGSANKLYAAPSGTQNYTATSTAGSGCAKTTSKSVTRNKHEFKGITDSNWNTASNWFPAVVPDNTKCANIPAGKAVVINTNAETSHLIIAATAKTTISANSSLKVTDAISITNNANNDNLVLESDAVLLQDNASAVNTGNIFAKRDVKMRKMDYTYWSSPVKSQILKNTGGTTNPTTYTTGGFSEGTPNNRIYQYKESNDTFTATADANFADAKGYAIRGKDTYDLTNLTSDNALKFIGIPNNGSYSIAIQRTANSGTGGTIEHGYNLIGNPYPSNIDFVKFYNLDNNKNIIFPKAWFWTNITPVLNQSGSNYTGNNYATITLSGGTPPTYSDTTVTPGSPSGDYTPTKNIRVGQGFIVQARSLGTNQILNFDNTIRNNESGHFYNNKQSLENDIDRYWVKLVSPEKIVNTILVAHTSDASNQYDADYDADLLSVGDDSFYSKLDTHKLQIQGRNVLSLQDVIPLGNKYSMNGLYKIVLGNKEGIFGSNQKIYLHDKTTGTYTDLSEKDYSFNATKGTDETRFELVYKSQEVLGTGISVKSDFTVYRDGVSYVIVSSKKLGKVEMYDTSGKLIKTLNTSETKIRIDMSDVVNGIYVLKVENSGEAKTHKILK